MPHLRHAASILNFLLLSSAEDFGFFIYIYSVGIVRSRTQTMEFSFIYIYMICSVTTDRLLLHPWVSVYIYLAEGDSGLFCDYSQIITTSVSLFVYIPRRNRFRSVVRLIRESFCDTRRWRRPLKCPLIREWPTSKENSSLISHESKDSSLNSQHTSLGSSARNSCSRQCYFITASHFTSHSKTFLSLIVTVSTMGLSKWAAVDLKTRNQCPFPLLNVHKRTRRQWPKLWQV
jgi:hypothetical protein